MGTRLQMYVTEASLLTLAKSINCQSYSVTSNFNLNFMTNFFPHARHRNPHSQHTTRTRDFQPAPTTNNLRQLVNLLPKWQTYKESSFKNSCPCDAWCWVTITWTVESHRISLIHSLVSRYIGYVGWIYRKQAAQRRKKNMTTNNEKEKLI